MARKIGGFDVLLPRILGWAYPYVSLTHGFFPNEFRTEREENLTKFRTRILHFLQLENFVRKMIEFSRYAVLCAKISPEKWESGLRPLKTHAGGGRRQHVFSHFVSQFGRQTRGMEIENVRKP